MKYVIIAWCNSNEKDFENHVPLLFCGKRNQQLGFTTQLHVLFLSGIHLLSDAYKKTLADYGYVLHDVAKLYDMFAQHYAILNRFGDYEKRCFLRWLVIDQLFPGEKIIHIDGDVVFNEDPAVLARAVGAATFVLQGCPALTVINDRQWFEQYKSEFSRFTYDVEGYSAAAWNARKGWEVTFSTRWSGSRFRPIITSDQDFLSHVMHVGAIKQDAGEQLKYTLDDYIVFQNPLLIHMYHHDMPYRYQREQGVDYFSYTRADGPALYYKKKVLLWHMQSCFTFYASKLLLRKKYLINCKPFGRIDYNPSGKLFEDYLNKKIARFTQHITRRAVYQYFFQDYDFSGLMNRKRWWKAGLFE